MVETTRFYLAVGPVVGESAAGGGATGTALFDARLETDSTTTGGQAQPMTETLILLRVVSTPIAS